MHHNTFDMSIVYSEDDTFIMLFETEIIKPINSDLLKQKKLEESIKRLKIPWNLEYFYNKWYNIITKNTSKQSKDFIFIHNDIKKNIASNRKHLLNPETSEIKRKVYLAFYYAYLKSIEFLDEAYGVEIHLKGIEIIIDRVFLTHLLFRHFFRKEYIELSNDSSLFEDDSVNGRIDKLKHKLLLLNTLTDFSFNLEVIFTICFFDNTNFYKLHLERIDASKYRIITYYVVDNELEIEEIKKLKKDRIDENYSVLYKP